MPALRQWGDSNPPLSFMSLEIIHAILVFTILAAFTRSRFIKAADGFVT